MAARHRRAGGAEGPRAEVQGEAIAPAYWLIDNSALQRVDKPEVYRALEELNERSGRLATCLPLQLEAGFSPKNLAGYDQVMALLASWEVLPVSVRVPELAMDFQRRLFAASKGRAAGAFDLMIAAVALAVTESGSPTVVVHYDGDFDHLASVEIRLRTRWVVPRGSVD